MKRSHRQRAFFRLRILVSLSLLLTGALLAVIAPGSLVDALAQQPPPSVSGSFDPPGLRVIAPFHSDMSRPLREAPTSFLRPPPAMQSEIREELNPSPAIPHVDGVDPVI